MLNRRQILKSLAAATGLALFGGFAKLAWDRIIHRRNALSNKDDTMILKSFPLDFQWPTQEPFLFCVHHYDRYPRGNGQFAPSPELLRGRNIGMDFEERDGFRMYHGDTVPGFPVHPHRGFETITIVRKGYVDHADSMGAAGRYGEGDVQWMTAGGGVQHSEMFPLLHSDRGNTVELFQIWLNLPKRSKMVPAHFTMFWAERIPQVDLDGGKTSVSVIAGELAGAKALAPPPDSWAADPQNEVVVLLVRMKKGGRLELPASSNRTTRTLYFFEGASLSINGRDVSARTGHVLDGQGKLEIEASSDGVELLVLQAKPIGEPTVQYGPFVMNSREEIIRTMEDYRNTEFGGWSWPRRDMVHGPVVERFARFPDGRIEKPTKA